MRFLCLKDKGTGLLLNQRKENLDIFWLRMQKGYGGKKEERARPAYSSSLVRTVTSLSGIALCMSRTRFSPHELAWG